MDYEKIAREWLYSNNRALFPNTPFTDVVSLKNLLARIATQAKAEQKEVDAKIADKCGQEYHEKGMEISARSEWKNNKAAMTFAHLTDGANSVAQAIRNQQDKESAG